MTKPDGGDFVTRAGKKLDFALSHFSLSPAGLVCLDVGCAEGGFTDCLLRHGAAKVYAVDVAYGSFDWRLRHDERVVLLERTNARYLDGDKIPEAVDLVTCDVSFISIKKIIPALLPLVRPGGQFVLLYKPQFELPRDQVGKNGIAKDPAYVADGLADMTAFLTAQGITIEGTAPSPLAGKKGNVEWLIVGRGLPHTSTPVLR